MFRIACFFVAVPAIEDNGRLHITSLFVFRWREVRTLEKAFQSLIELGDQQVADLSCIQEMLHHVHRLVFLHSPMNGETWWSLPHSGMENFDNSFGVSSCRETPEAGAQCESSYATAWRTRGVSWAALQLLGDAGTKPSSLIETAQTSLEGSPWQTAKVQGIWVSLIFTQEFWHNFMRLKKAGNYKDLYSPWYSCQAQSRQAHLFFALFNFTFPILELGEFALLKLYTNICQSI